MITTKLTIKLEISTQFGPADAVQMIDNLTRIPAIKSVEVISLKTNYDTTGRLPQDVNVKAINNIPFKIR